MEENSEKKYGVSNPVWTLSVFSVAVRTNEHWANVFTRCEEVVTSPDEFRQFHRRRFNSYHRVGGTSRLIKGAV